MTESVEGGIFGGGSRREDKRRFVVRSGERELSLKPKSAQRQPVAAAARRPRIAFKRVNISRRALRVVEGESRDNERAHERAGLCLCADTLSHSSDDDRTPGKFSLGLSEFGARERPPCVPALLPPNPPVVRARPPCLRRALPSRDRVSESTSD